MLLPVVMSDKNNKPSKYKFSKHPGDRSRESNLETAIDVLQTVFKKSKGAFSDEFSRFQLEKNWEKVIGKDMASEAFPRKIYKSTLYLSASSSEAQHHFRFSQDIIIKQINDFFGEKKIEHLNFSQKPKTKEQYSIKAKEWIKKIKE